MKNLHRLIDFFVFILFSRERNGGAAHRMNPDSLISCLYFRVFRLSVASDFLNLLLIRFHRAKIIIVKHPNQGRSNYVSVGVELSVL